MGSVDDSRLEVLRKRSAFGFGKRGESYDLAREGLGGIA